ncbi:MAG: hypothetical protein PHD86_05670 [Kiritimatiellae bacterium]|nr:hypothetical protein [Kiritimatiellia bacterium]
MHVVLIQPPEGTAGAAPLRLARKNPATFAPDWDVLCLQAYLKGHSRHLSTCVDCRLFTDLELELEHALNAVKGPKIIAVHTSLTNIGESAAVLELSRRKWPEIRTVMFGQFPSQFPEHIHAVARADYALSGDPEPILRALLDHIDSEKRLQNVPGLNFPGKNISTSWMPDLNILSLPDWGRVFWRAYHHPDQAGRQPARMRLSRGHTQEACDRAMGLIREPLRLWPMDKLAQSVRASSDLGVTDIFLTDPPGVWNEGRLREWCRALNRIYNKQPWGLQLNPGRIEDDLIAELAATRCRRVDFIVPSCDQELQERFGVPFRARTLRHTISSLEKAGVEVFVRLWIGGPEEKKGAVRRAVALIHHLPAAHIVLEPFPFCMDSPLYRSAAADCGASDIDNWLRWTRDPWILDRPEAVWNARAGAEALQKQITGIYRRVVRSPRWQSRRLGRLLKSSYAVQTIREGADWIAGRLPRRA